MPAARNAPGVGNHISSVMMKVFWAIVFIGVGLGILRIFGGDPIALFRWLWYWFTYMVNTVANFVSGSAGSVYAP